MRLRAGDVHHREQRPADAHLPGDPQRSQRAAGEQPERAARRPGSEPQRLLRRGVQEEGAGIEHRQARLAGEGVREQAGRELRGDEHVQAQHAHRDAPAIGGEGHGVELDHRARERHLRVRGDARVEPLVESAGRAAVGRAQLEVGLAAERAHRGTEFAQRGLIDQLNRECEGDAEHDREQRRRIAPRMQPEFGPRQGLQQREHQLPPGPGLLPRADARRLTLTGRDCMVSKARAPHRTLVGTSCGNGGWQP